MKTKSTFKEREGILFLAAFHGAMYYNGDAIWWFLKHVYPMILETAPKPIPLTIAGRNIAPYLIEMAQNDTRITEHVHFDESPDDISPLYEKARVFVAPHLYGAGIQYKMSETFAKGLPVVMSLDAATNWGPSRPKDAGCVGHTPQAMRDCVLLVHNNEQHWNLLREQGFRFMEQTHKRSFLSRTWKSAISSAVSTLEKRRKCQS